MIKRLFSVFLCLILLASTQFSFEIALSSEPSENELSFFYGTVARLGDSDFFIVPEYIHSSAYLGTHIGENLTEIKLNFKNSFFEKASKNVSIVGDWNMTNGCVDVMFCHEDVEHFTGTFEDGFFVTFGKKYFPFFAGTYSCDLGKSADVDIFAKKLDKMMVVYSVAPKKETKTTMTGNLEKSELEELFFIKKEKSGRKITTTTYELVFDDKSQIFEGRNRIELSQIIPGRVAVCDGFIDNSSKSILVDALICNVNQATDGGRMIGIIAENDGESLVIKTIINQFVQLEFEVTPTIKSWIIHDEKILNFKELLKIPIDIPVEVVGVFRDINGEFSVDVINTKPEKSSDFVFGVWDETTESIIDYYGNPHKSIIDDHTWIYSPGGPIEDNTILYSWIRDENSVGVYVPELGLIGVRMTGWFEAFENGAIKLNCLGSIDYDLQGKNIDIFCGRGCKIIKGGFGFVDAKNLEKGTLLHCWGIPDFSGGFDALMISVH